MSGILIYTTTHCAAEKHHVRIVAALTPSGRPPSSTVMVNKAILLLGQKPNEGLLPTT